MFHEYLDFEIRIGALENDGYPVSVRAPGGDARGLLVLPAHSPLYQGAIERLGALDTDEEHLAGLGRLLFEALFTPAIKDVYARTQGKLKDDQRLRLIFDIDAREAAVAAVPWEFLADPDQGPLAMLDAPMVRYLPIPASIPTLAAPLPLKLLLTSAATSSPTQIERELREIQSALEDLGRQVSIAVEPHLTRSILLRRLREGHHVWHFVGQGDIRADGKTGILQFENEAGGAELVSAPELTILLKRSGVRLVVLNAGQSAALQLDPFRSLAPALVRAEVPAVIAMQLSVPDTAARAFAREFYQALAEGHPIDACVCEARKAVMSVTGLNRPDWGLAVVYTRAPDGRLFAPPAPPVSAMPANPHPIGDGLLALRTLMGTPAVYAAVVSGRAQFEDVLRQIATLNRYKKLHDGLQQLEGCARIVDQNRHRLPKDLHAWEDLKRNEPDLHTKIDVVLELAGNAPESAPWTRKLELAQQEARMGIERGNLDLLDRATNGIDNVLGSEPWRINVRLVEVARGLPLQALTKNLSLVARQLDILNLDEWAARQFEVFVQGVAALERLDIRLAQLVRQHDLFQYLDHELRQVASSLDSNGGNLALVWPDLQQLNHQVCDDESAGWAPSLVTIATELENSLKDPTRQRTTMILWRYCDQVSLCFNYVDIDLLRLCEELQGIGKSLDFVLRTAP